MPADPITILSTKELEPSLLAEFRSMKICNAAMITIVSLNKQATVQALATHPVRAIFTSQHAVEIVRDALSGIAVNQWKIACVGGATATIAREVFGADVVDLTASDAGGLAAAIVEESIRSRGTEPPERVFFSGDRRLDLLPDVLNLAGLSWRELTVYQTLHTPVKVNTKYEAILFFSPSAVESFCSINQVPPGVTIFAIGSTTAKAVSSRLSRNAIISKGHSAKEMLETVHEYFINQTGSARS